MCGCVLVTDYVRCRYISQADVNFDGLVSMKEFLDMARHVLETRGAAALKKYVAHLKRHAPQEAFRRISITKKAKRIHKGMDRDRYRSGQQTSMDLTFGCCVDLAHWIVRNSVRMITEVESLIS